MIQVTDIIAQGSKPWIMDRRSRLFPRRDRLWTNAILLVCSVYAGINLAHLTVQEYHLLRQAAILWEEQRIVNEKHSVLQKNVAEARSHLGTEMLARKALGMAKPGEIPVRFMKGATPRIINQVE